MSLTPTPVVLQNLIDAAADINLFNDGIKTQLVSPRDRSPEVVVVQVKDDPLAPSFGTGVANANVVNSLVDTTVNFVTLGVSVGDSAINTAAHTSAVVTAITTTTNPNDTLVLGTNDIFPAGTEAYSVIPASFWVQKFFGGEWKKSNYKKGNNKRVTYNLPTTGTVSSVLVHEVVYPVLTPENTGFYPPSANA